MWQMAIKAIKSRCEMIPAPVHEALTTIYAFVRQTREVSIAVGVNGNAGRAAPLRPARPRAFYSRLG
jgi:hypothetical protein